MKIEHEAGSPEQQISAAIIATLTICALKTFRTWSDAWLANEDRSEQAAELVFDAMLAEDPQYLHNFGFHGASTCVDMA
jgi:hypothetical protein